MTSPILVTGGTGTLGRFLVPRLRDAGRDVRVLSRSGHDHGKEHGRDVEFVRGDLLTGEGINAAVKGVSVVLHCASGKKGDEAATGNLVEVAARQAARPHLVYPSVVGVEALSLGYFRAKLRSEQAVTDSELPWTIARFTQFYDYIFSGARSMAKMPVVPVPAGFRVQPIDPDEVAARLVELALGDPAGRVADLGGPQESTWADMVRAYLRAGRRRKPVLPVRLPGLAKVRAGHLLPAGPVTGRKTWEEFLTEKLH
ncbi:SDR family oxidoreductase [Streptomyces sp. MAR4 CNX-425]|uniref:SDR family oxidoreductase n=1 Tax=Streptomyces sp. MAR4 CNX-425 TaxID=3406343 RepID=UPI003B50831B